MHNSVRRNALLGFHFGFEVHVRQGMGRRQLGFWQLLGSTRDHATLSLERWGGTPPDLNPIMGGTPQNEKRGTSRNGATDKLQTKEDHELAAFFEI